MAVMGVAALVVVEMMAMFLTWRDPSLPEVLWKWIGVLAWPVAAGFGLWRGSWVGLPIWASCLGGAIVIAAACLGTGGLPTILFLTSTRREGKVVPALRLRRVLGWVFMVGGAILAGFAQIALGFTP